MSNLFIRLNKTGKRVTGYEVRKDVNFDSKENSDANEVEISESKTLDTTLKELSDEYFNAALTYLDFVPMMLMLAPMFSIDAITASILRYLEKHKVSVKKTKDSDIYEIDSADYREFARLTQHLHPSSDVTETTARNAILGLVALLDALLTNLSRIIILQRGHIVEKSDRTFTPKELLSFKSFDDVRESIVDGELDKLAYRSFEDRVEWIEKAINISPPISEKHQSWDNLLELTQRRNLFAHTSGHVSKRYLEMGIERSWSKEDLVEGKKLRVDPKYYNAAVRLAFEFGVKLVHVVRKKLGPKANPTADSYINDVGYRLLVRGDYDLAEKILSFAYDLRDVEDRAKKMSCVNLANAKKLIDLENDCNDLLSSHDWTATSVDFHVCIAAVKGEVDKVVQLMHKIGKSKDVGEAAYREWPAFFHVRTDPKFIAAYEEIFGVLYRPSAKLSDAWNDIVANLRPEKKRRKPKPSGTAADVVNAPVEDTKH
jgi:hypothetical protein